MSELPNGWAEARLDMVSDINPGRLAGLEPDQQISFVPMPAVSDTEGEILSPSSRPYGEVSKGYTQFQEGDVIFAKITPCMENGKIAVARALENGVACGSTEFHVLRPLGGISPDYFWRFLRQRSYRVQAEASMTGAVGQRRVPAEFLRTTQMPLPPLCEQKRIVAKIDSLSVKSKRANDHLNHIPRLAEKYKQAVLPAAFRGDFSPGLDREQFENHSLASVTALTFYGPRIAKEAYVADGIPTLRTTDIAEWGRVVPKDPPHVSVSEAEFSKWRFEAGDLMVTRTGATIGKCAVYEDDMGPALPSAYLIPVRLHRREIDPRFAVLFLLSSAGQRQLLDGRTAVAQPNINADAIISLRLPLPPIAEQQSIVKKVDRLFLWVDRLASEAVSARRLIDNLDQAVLAKAFRGELVSQDPSDEPAAELLKRIAAGRADAPKAKRSRSRKE